jgi:hypothetical protein
MNAGRAVVTVSYNALTLPSLHQDFLGPRRSPPVLSLLIQAMKADVKGRRVAALLKRLHRCACKL